MTWHQTIIVGNLGQDPEMRYTQDGTAVCSFSVAVSERWTDRRSGERRERTTWYRVSAWRGLGETCNRFLSKGRQVMVIGRVSARAYTNREGEAAASLGLDAREVQFLGSGRSSGDATDGYGQSGGQKRESFAPPARRSSSSPETRGDYSSKEDASSSADYDDIDDIPF